MQRIGPKTRPPGQRNTRESFHYTAARKRLLRHLVAPVSQRPPGLPQRHELCKDGAFTTKMNQTNHEEARLGERGGRAE